MWAVLKIRTQDSPHLTHKHPRGEVSAQVRPSARHPLLYTAVLRHVHCLESPVLRVIQHLSPPSRDQSRNVFLRTIRTFAHTHTPLTSFAMSGPISGHLSAACNAPTASLERCCVSGIPNCTLPRACQWRSSLRHLCAAYGVDAVSWRVGATDSPGIGPCGNAPLRSQEQALPQTPRPCWPS